jgi:hypothetical protein
MSKDLAFDYAESEVIENPPLIIEEEDSAYIALLKRIQSKEETLSFSSLKEFSTSPKNFIKYKLKDRKKPTDAVLEGSVCDALLCDHIRPERLEFESNFSIVENTPTTDNQIAFCNYVLAGNSAEESKRLANPRGDANDLLAMYQSFIDASKSGKQSVSKALYKKCFAIVDGLKKSELVNSLLDSVIDVQVKQEWEFKGYKFKGYKDAQGNNLLIDFKKMADANPDKVEREIIQRKIYLQMGMYAESFEGIPEVYLIVFDATGNFSVIKIDYSLISYGKREYQYLVTKFDQCVKQNRWSESYNFFDVQQRTVYKPKWIKGFETDPEDVE